MRGAVCRAESSFPADEMDIGMRWLAYHRPETKARRFTERVLGRAAFFGSPARDGRKLDGRSP